MPKPKIFSLALICLLCSKLATAQTGYINTIAGTGVAGYSGDGGPASLAQFNHPTAAARDNAGNLFIADGLNHAIRKIDASGFISTIAGTGTAGYSGDGGPATSAQLNYPEGLAIDAAGNIFIADENNRVVRKINTAGIISTYAGTGAVGFSGDGGPPNAAKLADAYDVALDASGNLYIVDGQNQRIRKVTPAGIISTFAGGALTGLGDGGPATSANLFWPESVSADAAGNIYIADEGRHRVRRVNPAGIITTYAGVGIGKDSLDGWPATSAYITSPTCVTVDMYGNVYISEGEKNIRKVNTAGIISRFAGMDTAAYSGDGGPAILAKIFGPAKIAVDPNMNVYIPEFYGHRIRKVNGVPTGISALSKSSNITIHPNPFSTAVTISCDAIISDIVITDLTGTIVNKAISKTSQLQLDLSNLPPGVYFAHINDNFVTKIIKQ